MIFPSRNYSNPPSLVRHTFHIYGHNVYVSPLYQASTTTYDILCVVDLLLDFHQHSCNTQRDQEVAALILFPQALAPTAPEDSTICSITQSLLFWEGGD